MNAKEIKNLTGKELEVKLANLKSELFNLRFSHATGALANPLALNVCKKEIAKVKTVIRERQLGIISDIAEKPAKPVKEKIPAEPKKTTVKKVPASTKAKV